jgi:hypothetical protein
LYFVKFIFLFIFFAPKFIKTSKLLHLLLLICYSYWESISFSSNTLKDKDFLSLCLHTGIALIKSVLRFSLCHVIINFSLFHLFSIWYDTLPQLIKYLGFNSLLLSFYYFISTPSIILLFSNLFLWVTLLHLFWHNYNTFLNFISKLLIHLIGFDSPVKSTIQGFYHYVN